MNEELIDRIKADMAYEFARTAPPTGFPAFHDIPVGRHTSDEFAALEADHLWARTWVIAGRAEDVPNPGDYAQFKELGVPLLLVRGTDNIIRCFYNTCQHRGAPVVRDLQGSSRRLRCQYHSWTYEIDRGELVAVPDERDFVDLDWQQRCLPQARAEVFAGFIFVNRDLDAPPLLEWLGATADMFEPFKADDLREVYRESRIVPCNWKVTAEAFLEVYHFRHIHSHDGVSVLDNRGAAMGLYPNGHSRMVTPYSEQNCARMGMQGWDDWKQLAAPGLETIADVPAMVDCTSTAVSLFPNAIMPLGSIGFPVNLFWPIDATTTRLDWIYYAKPPAGQDHFDADNLPPAWQARRTVYNQIMAEDEMNMAPMQESMQSPALSGIPINYQERRIWHLHEQIDRTIGVERIPEHLRVEQLLGPWIENESPDRAESPERACT